MAECNWVLSAKDEKFNLVLTCALRWCLYDEAQKDENKSIVSLVHNEAIRLLPELNSQTILCMGRDLQSPIIFPSVNDEKIKRFWAPFRDAAAILEAGADKTGKKTEERFVMTDSEACGAILLCAVRYACGRETYVTGAVSDFVSWCAPVILPKYAKLIAECIEERSRQENLGHPSIDAPLWIDLKSKLEKEKLKKTDD